jgi:hypothetical protein
MKKLKKIATAILGMAAVLLTVLSNSISDAFAADINCANVVTTCVGTTWDDRMVSGEFLGMDGNQGNDQVVDRY